MNDIQKKVNVISKEAENISANNDERKVMLTGSNLESAISNSRYMPIFLLFKTMESKLQNRICYDINLSYLTLEALKKALIEIGDYEKFVALYKENIEPINFFKLINDLSTQAKYTSGREVANKFLTSSIILTKLNSFYNDFNDIYNNCLKNKYILLYLFDSSGRGNLPTMLNSFENLKEYFNNKSNEKEEKQKRNIIYYLFVELENETKKCGIGDDTKDEYYHKMQKINNNIDDIFSKIDLNGLYSIDYLCYELLSL